MNNGILQQVVRPLGSLPLGAAFTLVGNAIREKPYIVMLSPGGLGMSHQIRLLFFQVHGDQATAHLTVFHPADLNVDLGKEPSW